MQCKMANNTVVQAAYNQDAQFRIRLKVMQGAHQTGDPNEEDF